jgi:hypothetical protein
LPGNLSRYFPENSGNLILAKMHWPTHDKADKEAGFRDGIRLSRRPGIESGGYGAVFYS